MYLVDEPFYDIAMAYASQDAGARVVLLQDAVYFATGAQAAEVYVIRDDVNRRGLELKVHNSVRVIDYRGLVEMMEKERVVNFL